MLRSRTALGVVVLAFVTSCRTGLPVRTFSTQEAAGTVHVAVQSVAAFDEEYIEQLQPKFDPNDVTSASAITLTRIRELEQLRDLLLQASVGLQSSTITRSKTTKMGEVTDNTTTETTTPPALDKLPTAPSSTTGLPVPLTLPIGLSPALDQALTFRAVAALKQEVALLNRFVRDAAVARGTRPYVVRLLVTLNPSAHFEPYNAYTTISLFSETAETHIPWYAAGVPNAPQLLATASAETCGKPVEIVPLFVTDNLESSFDNLAAQRNLGVSGAASGIVQNTAASVGGNFRSQDLEQDQGRTVNALYTVARLSSNTIEARLGAPVAGRSYETIPRTYNVTVLALVPTARAYLDRHSDSAFAKEDVAQIAEDILPCRDIAFTSIAWFVDARTGVVLPSRFADRSAVQLRALAKNWNFGPTAAQLLPELLAYAEYDAFDKFEGAITKDNLGRNDLQAGAAAAAAGTAPLERMLWLDLVSIVRNSGRGYGRFTLPVADIEFFPSNTSGTVFDDGTTSRLTLSGAHGLTASGLLATLEMDGIHTIPSSAIKVTNDGRSATVEFPSLKKLLNKSPTSIAVVVERQKRLFSSSTTFQWKHSTSDPPDKPRLTYLGIPKPQPKPPVVTMEVTAPHIVITDANAGGTLAIAFQSTEKTPPKVRFAVSGGYIVDTTPATVADAADRVGPGSGVYVLSLRNLAAGGKMTVSAFADDSGSRGDSIGEKTIDVVAGLKRESDKN
jgi:hypothetical protein